MTPRGLGETSWTSEIQNPVRSLVMWGLIGVGVLFFAGLLGAGCGTALIITTLRLLGFF